MAGRRVLVVSNPVASGVTPRVERAVLAALAPHAACELVRTERPLHAVELASRGVDEGFDAVIVMAGDGTMNEVVNGVGDRVPLGILPCGGTSVLARSTGLPLSADFTSMDSVVMGGSARRPAAKTRHANPNTHLLRMESIIPD